jgi:hypothetical protein
LQFPQTISPAKPFNEQTAPYPCVRTLEFFPPASSLLRWSIGHKWPWSEVINDDFVGRNKRASLFERHVEAEFAGDLDTMATTTDPHLNHLPDHGRGRGPGRRAPILSGSSHRQVLSSIGDDDYIAHRRQDRVMDEIAITFRPPCNRSTGCCPGSSHGQASRWPSRLGLLTRLPVGGAEIAHNVRCRELDRARAGPKNSRGRDDRERRHPPGGDSRVAHLGPSACASLPRTQEPGMEQA